MGEVSVYARLCVDGPMGELPLLVNSPLDIGIRISNSVPRRGPAVSDRMQKRSPPILRAIPLATSKPKPRPSFCRVKESSSREKALNKLGMNASGIPGPVSVILMTIERDLGLRLALSDILPHSVNLTAFKRTQETSLARSRSSTIADLVSVQNWLTG